MGHPSGPSTNRDFCLGSTTKGRPSPDLVPPSPVRPSPTSPPSYLWSGSETGSGVVSGVSPPVSQVSPTVRRSPRPPDQSSFSKRRPGSVNLRKVFNRPPQLPYFTFSISLPPFFPLSFPPFSLSVTPFTSPPSRSDLDVRRPDTERSVERLRESGSKKK